MKKLRWALAQYFEQRWWKNYLKSKDLNSYIQWKKGYWKQFIDGLPYPILLQASGNYLDAGCGPAGINMVLPGQVTAIDPLLTNYHSQFPFFKPSEYPNVTFKQATLEDYIPSQTFAIVFCLNVINHVQNIKKAMLTLKQCCAESGILVLSVDVHNYRWLCWLFRLVQADVMHPQQFDEEAYQKLLEDTGFKVLAKKVLKKELIFSYKVYVAQKQ